MDIAIDEMPESFAIKRFLRKKQIGGGTFCVFTSFSERDEKCIHDEGFEEGVRGAVLICSRTRTNKRTDYLTCAETV